MSKTFERFLHSFSDEELSAFARERGRIRPPYWKVMRLALRIEASRRGLAFEEDVAELLSAPTTKPDVRTGTA